MQRIAADREHLGTRLGPLAVLHTRGQDLQHHPHVHCVVPGGGISTDASRWVACRPGSFPPVRVLSRVFRGKFLSSLRAASDRGRLGFRGELGLKAVEFIRRFLLHLLPTGFVRIRHYGFPANRVCREQPGLCRDLLATVTTSVGAGSPLGPTGAVEGRPQQNTYNHTIVFILIIRNACGA